MCRISERSPLVLGSASPRRRELIAQLGLPFRVTAADVAEQQQPAEKVDEYLARIVVAKLRAVAHRVPADTGAAILVADTIVVVDGEIIGKPKDLTHAEELLGRLVGRTHWVYTRYGVSVADRPDRLRIARTVRSGVTLRDADKHELSRYAATGEGLDKAGAYAVQGLGAFLVREVHGSYTNVVGLPVCELTLDLRELGLLGPFP